MKRLTDKHFNKLLGYYMKCSGCCERSIACNECEEFEALVDRLGAIEAILGDDYDLDRLRELVEADQDGRYVVLPCKVGSPVWRVYDDCEFPGDCGTKQKCNGCEYRNIFAEEQAFCLSMLSQNGKLGHPYYTSIEAAEAALKGDLHGKA